MNEHDIETCLTCRAMLNRVIPDRVLDWADALEFRQPLGGDAFSPPPGVDSVFGRLTRHQGSCHGDT